MKFLHSPMDSCKHYLQSREVQTDALRFFMCIYAALNYILLPKGQILKCPAWMHKVQSGNYAFLYAAVAGTATSPRANFIP